MGAPFVSLMAATNFVARTYFGPNADAATRDAFQAFLNAKHGGEIGRFLSDMRAYRTKPTAAQARIIFDTFVAAPEADEANPFDSAPSDRLNLPAAVVKEVQTHMLHPDASTFDAAVLEVDNLLAQNQLVVSFLAQQQAATRKTAYTVAKGLAVLWVVAMVAVPLYLVMRE